MGKTFENNDQAEAPYKAEQGPKADDGITEEMRFMPCCVKIEHHEKRQKDKKDPFQHT
jgi:hypothetical protein